jgi:hypothetical protein
VQIHTLYNVHYDVRFHFPKEFKSDTKRLARVVRMIDEMHPWNVDEADQIECLPHIFSYSYADIGDVCERRVIVTPADSQMPLGKLNGYQNHVDRVRENFQAWKNTVMPEVIAINVICQFS